MSIGLELPRVSLRLGLLWAKLLPFMVRFYPAFHLLEMRTRLLRIKAPALTVVNMTSCETGLTQLEGAQVFKEIAKWN